MFWCELNCWFIKWHIGQGLTWSNWKHGRHLKMIFLIGQLRFLLFIGFVIKLWLQSVCVSVCMILQLNVAPFLCLVYCFGLTGSECSGLVSRHREEEAAGCLFHLLLHCWNKLLPCETSVPSSNENTSDVITHTKMYFWSESSTD